MSSATAGWRTMSAPVAILVPALGLVTLGCAMMCSTQRVRGKGGGGMTRKLMTSEELVLAALSGEVCRPFEPVHVQKLLFLIDARLSEALGGPYFAFQPYDYGPYDKNVYGVLESLASRGLVSIEQSAHSRRSYSLTPEGAELGNVALSKMPPSVAEHVKVLAHFVRGLGFTQLVSAVYRAYPEMRANSVFNDQQ